MPNVNIETEKRITNNRFKIIQLQTSYIRYKAVKNHKTFNTENILLTTEHGGSGGEPGGGVTL